MLIDGVSLNQISNQQIPSNFLVEYWHNLGWWGAVKSPLAKDLPCTFNFSTNNSSRLSILPSGWISVRKALDNNYCCWCSIFNVLRLVWNLNNLLLKWIIESYSSLMLYKNNWLIHVARSIHSRLMSNCTKCIVSCVNACMYPETLSRNTEQERNQDATFQVHEIDVNCERF